MPSNRSRKIALGGVLAAVAVVIMCLGGLIPIATYVCPMLCALTQFLVMRFCGRQIGWAWFAVVAVLSLLMSPDKEAAMVFVAVGYYPLVKEVLERMRLRFLWKFLCFNSSILVAYGIMIYLFGMQEVVAENSALGAIGLLVILLMGNVTFFLLDRLLTIMARKLR